jgi:hypothetical protein
LPGNDTCKQSSLSSLSWAGTESLLVFIEQLRSRLHLCEGICKSPKYARTSRLGTSHLAFSTPSTESAELFRTRNHCFGHVKSTKVDYKGNSICHRSVNVLWMLKCTRAENGRWLLCHTSDLAISSYDIDDSAAGNTILDRQGGTRSIVCIVCIVGVSIDFEYKRLHPLRLCCDLHHFTYQKSREVDDLCPTSLSAEEGSRTDRKWIVSENHVRGQIRSADTGVRIRYCDNDVG